MSFGDRINTTWGLMKSSFEVIRQDKHLLIFPLMSTLAVIVILASFTVPILFAESFDATYIDEAFSTPLGFFFLFLFYFITYFIVIFFNSAVVGCAVARMQGITPSIRLGLRTATYRIGQILGWAILSATVGMIINTIENQSKTAGKIMVWLIGLSWTVFSFLVIPIIVVEGKGPVEAMKTSSKMLKSTWGEQLIGHFSFGLLFFFLALPAVFIMIISGILSPVLFVMMLVICVLYFFFLALLQTTAQSVFMAAVYMYAADKKTPVGFDADQISYALSK
jgi:MFS family permease